MKIDKSLKDIGVSGNSKLVFLYNKAQQDKKWNLLQFHYHEVYEILICIDVDEVICFAGNQVYDMKKGSVFIFAPYTLHRTTVAENSKYDRFVIYFSKNDLIEFSPYSKILLSFFNSGFLNLSLNENEIQDILEIINDKSFPDSAEFMKEAKDRLKLFRLIMYLGEKIQTPRINGYTKYDELNNILDYIQENINNTELTLASVSKQFFISTTSLNALFKNYLNSTVKEYIILRRINMAQDLLRGNTSVSEVCERVGFNNYSHFIRTFTKITGISPKQYSKQYTSFNT